MTCFSLWAGTLTIERCRSIVLYLRTLILQPRPRLSFDHHPATTDFSKTWLKQRNHLRNREQAVVVIVAVVAVVVVAAAGRRSSSSRSDT